MSDRLPEAPVTCRTVAIIVTALALAACGNDGAHSASGQNGPSRATSAAAAATTPAATTHHAVPQTVQGTHSFRSVRLGFRLDYPADMASSIHFDSKYLAADNWKTYAPSDSTGSPVLMLTVPGSNDVTAGELRIGVSSNKQALAQCRQPPSNAKQDSIGKATINGTRFARFNAADAGMSHYLDVHSYRTLHGGYCYAIDLLVTGTNPHVYDPPRKPPFSHAEAFAQLHKALAGFRFTR